MAANAVECIRSVEDLQRVAELGTWYESEEDSDSEIEETDSGPCQPNSEVALAYKDCQRDSPTCS